MTSNDGKTLTARTMPQKPLAIRVLNNVGDLPFIRKWLNSLTPLAADKLLDNSCKKSAKTFGKKLTDFDSNLYELAEVRFKGNLEKSVNSFSTEADLSPLGQIAASGMVSKYLINRLGLVQYFKDNPSALRREIQQPIFVVGLPRTGTSILYSLLSQNPDFRSPLTWELSHPPFPYQPGQNPDRDAQCIKVNQGELDLAHKLDPEIDKMHAMHSLYPEECHLISAHEFTCAQHAAIFNSPSYQKWLRNQSYLGAYEFHKRYLQYLQAEGSNKTWLLKSPEHIGTLTDLLRIYPDARIVNIHRDPTESIGSLASLIFHSRSLLSNRVEPYVVGKQVLDLTDWQIRQLFKVREEHKFDHNICDVYYRDFIADPNSVVIQIYKQFGIELSEDLEHKMQDFMNKNAKGKNSSYSYSLEEFGLNRSEVSARFADYICRFGLT